MWKVSTTNSRPTCYERFTIQPRRANINNMLLGCRNCKLSPRSHPWPACRTKSVTRFYVPVSTFESPPKLRFTDRGLIGRTACATVSRLMCGYQADGGSRRKGWGENSVIKALHWIHKTLTGTHFPARKRVTVEGSAALNLFPLPST